MADRICSVDECGLPVHSRSLCSKHYMRWSRYGDPLGGATFRKKWPESLLSRMEPQPNGCIYFTGHINRDGYGTLSRDGRTIKAHRAAYEHFVGPIPEGMELDHLCRNRQCCNVAHLEPVTHDENMRRGAHAIKTHCIHGHEYTEANTYRTKMGGRRCRSCDAKSAERSRDKLRLASWPKEEGA